MALCGAIVCHYLQCAMCARGRGDLWCSLSVHSLPGKTPSPCTPSQYTASNNLTFDCFEQLALRCAFFFCYHFFPSQFLSICWTILPSSAHIMIMISTIGLDECLDMLCAEVACVRIIILFFMWNTKKGQATKKGVHFEFERSCIFNRLVIVIQNKYASQRSYIPVFCC